MNRLIFRLAFVLVTLAGVAQVNVSGVVVEDCSNEPLTGTFSVGYYCYICAKGYPTTSNSDLA